MLKDWVLAFSLANLLFLRVWITLLYSRGYDKNASLTGAVFLGAVFNVTLLALVLLGTLWLLRRAARSFVHEALPWFALLVWFTLLDYLRVRVLWNAPFLGNRFGWLIFPLLFGAPVAFGCLALLRWRASILPATAWLLWILSPLVPFFFGQAYWRWVRADTTAGVLADKPAQREIHRPGGARVVWMVFDEMGQDCVFDTRPGSVRLPEMDRFRQESVYAASAFPPGQTTMLSMPALINGHLVAVAEAATPNELMLTYKDSAAPVPWSKEPNVFRSARAMGLQTALVGWAHPYCRLLGSALDSCTVPESITLAAETDLSKAMLRQMHSLVPDTLLTNHTFREEQTALYRQILDRSRSLAGNGNIDFMLIHWPVPHVPGIYDRHTQQFSHSGNYLDNLELADHTLGEIRREMEKENLWNDSHVIVTADHWWRPTLRNQFPGWLSEEGDARGGRQDLRVVFMLKMAGQTEGRTISESFNTVLLHDLILELLSGRVSTPDQAVAWIQASPTAGRGESLVVRAR